MTMGDVIPTQSEIRERMGPSMADIFFDYCHPDSRQLLGVIPPLQGPHKALLIPPSDQSIQKVALVSPSINNRVKACTHQEILAIGQNAMKKAERNLYEEMLRNYEDENKEKHNIFEAEKRRALKLKEDEIRCKYDNSIKDLQGEFEQKLQTTLAKEIEKCTKSIQKAVFKERADVIRMMLQRLRNDMSEIIDSVVGNFEDIVRAQRENMIAGFNESIRRERERTNDRMKEMEQEKNQALEIQRRELEMQNSADVTYVLCLERLRSSSEKHAIHLCFEQSIQALKALLSEANNVPNLSKKSETVDEDTVQLSCKHELLKVIREFQKFINFAFKAVPGQAEYLLPPKQLLILENYTRTQN